MNKETKPQKARRSVVAYEETTTPHRCLDRGIRLEADAHRSTCPRCGRRYRTSPLSRLVLKRV
jgi:hypothetical protein